MFVQINEQTRIIYKILTMSDLFSEPTSSHKRNLFDAATAVQTRGQSWCVSVALHAMFADNRSNLVAACVILAASTVVGHTIRKIAKKSFVA